MQHAQECDLETMPSGQHGAWSWETNPLASQLDAVGSRQRTYFFGDVSGVFETFMGASNTLINNQFSQKLETEADDFALRHASAAGLTPEDFADALESLASSLPPESEMDKILSSHPMLKDRIEKARAAQSSN